jgi:hypothetical protein
LETEYYTVSELHPNVISDHTAPRRHAKQQAGCPIFNAYLRGLPARIDSNVLRRADSSWFDAEYSSHPIFDAGAVGRSHAQAADKPLRSELMAA